MNNADVKNKPYSLMTMPWKPRAEGIEKGLERGRAEGIEKGREEGLEQGLERGKVEGSLSMLLNLVRQRLLTAEIASQQLGMTVAEFEALL